MRELAEGLGLGLGHLIAVVLGVLAGRWLARRIDRRLAPPRPRVLFGIGFGDPPKPDPEGGGTLYPSARKRIRRGRS